MGYGKPKKLRTCGYKVDNHKERKSQIMAISACYARIPKPISKIAFRCFLFLFIAVIFEIGSTYNATDNFSRRTGNQDEVPNREYAEAVAYRSRQ
jgi:hypothetical protein